MAKIHVELKRDFIESTLTPSKPVPAIAEMIWNGFDSGASVVQVNLDMDKLGGVESIRILDNGSGINHGEIQALFGGLGESWKKDKRRAFDRALHGKNGKGRFKAFALGTSVVWRTTYERDGKLYSYTIRGSTLNLKDFEVPVPKESPNAQQGTEVTITEIKNGVHALKEDTAAQELTRIFGAYLTEYPTLKLDFNGVRIDPRAAQNHQQTYDLGDVNLPGGGKAPVSVTVIEWKTPTERTIHLCDAKGISLSTVPAGQQIRAPDFQFTAYVKSDRFRELDQDGQLMMEDLNPDVQAIVKASKTQIKEHFRRRKLQNRGEAIARWKAEMIYPYEEKEKLDPVEEAERQVFDILAVNVESYLPDFEEYDTKSKRFTFRLLAQAVRENPDSVQRIISEVLGLKKEEQDDLAKLLTKTSLSSIINLAKIVADRLNFLAGLEDLIFTPAKKKVLLERDQLHPILDKEAWLFHEEFALAGSELRLEEALAQHLAILRKGEEDLAPVEVGEGKTGRIDLMLKKAIQPRAGEFDYLVVELKRPTRKIDADVLTQIKQYAMAVARDPRFHNVTTRWTFIAISNEMDDFAKAEANQRGIPRGRVYDDGDLHITAWVKTWSEVINDAKARLQFVSKQLAYEADRDSAKAYLKEKHEKFIPTQAQLDGKQAKAVEPTTTAVPSEAVAHVAAKEPAAAAEPSEETIAPPPKD
jgi:hypothetical protein